VVGAGVKIGDGGIVDAQVSLFGGGDEPCPGSPKTERLVGAGIKIGGIIGVDIGLFEEGKLIDVDIGLGNDAKGKPCPKLPECEPAYVGCFTDDIRRDLKNRPEGTGYNIAWCNYTCRDSYYFAIQNNGKECFCGDDYGTAEQYKQVSDDECGGSRGQGGPWRNSIYQSCNPTQAPTTFPTHFTRGDCLPVVGNLADKGYEDSYRGWYDVQGCGYCNDYCRWVGGNILSGSGGDPAVRLTKDGSYWSCYLAGSTWNTSREHFETWKFQKCSGQGAAAPSGCLPVVQQPADKGYADSHRGWYDVQGCGHCNDYCRWVGGDIFSGSGGDPAFKLTHSGSYWSCYLAGSTSNTSRNHFETWMFQKCSGQGAVAPKREEHLVYYLGEKGLQCTSGALIVDKEECIYAHKKLGLTHDSPWEGTSGVLPRGCSWKQSGRNFHFNLHEKGTARSDMTPVCRKQVTSTPTLMPTTSMPSARPTPAPVTLIPTKTPSSKPTSVPDVNCLGSWSVCNGECDDIVFTVQTSQSGKGSHCEAKAGDTRPCMAGDGDCTVYEDWTACSTSCGDGTQLRNCSGKLCKEDMMTQDCNLGECAEYGEWTSCSVSCGDGIELRSCSGLNCDKNLLSRECNLGPCDECTTKVGKKCKKALKIGCMQTKNGCMHWDNTPTAEKDSYCKAKGKKKKNCDKLKKKGWCTWNGKCVSA